MYKRQGYCRRIGAAYEKISEEYSDILVAGKVNIDEEPQIAEAEKIEIIPTLVLYRDGKAIEDVYKRQMQMLLDDADAYMYKNKQLCKKYN